MSYFLPEYNTLFLHIPRTGGHWMRRVFIDFYDLEPDRSYGRPVSTKASMHIPVCDYEQEDIDKLKHIICGVRNPIGYYESIWRWFKRSNHFGRLKTTGKPKVRHKGRRHALDNISFHYDPDFQIFLERTLEYNSGWITSLFSHFIYRKGLMSCDYIYRLETISDDLKWISYHIGMGDIYENIVKTGVTIDTRRRKNRKGLVPKVKWKKEWKELIYNSERTIFDKFYGDMVHKLLD